MTVVALILGYRAAKDRRIDEIMRRHLVVSRSLRELQSRSPVATLSLGDYDASDRLPNDEPSLTNWKESIRKSGVVGPVGEVSIQLNTTELAKSASPKELPHAILAFYTADLARIDLSQHSRGYYEVGVWELWFNESRDIVVKIDVSEIPSEYPRKYYSVRLQLIDLQRVGYW